MSDGKSLNTVLDLCDFIRERSFELHCFLRHGHLEKVYENGLTNRLRKHGIIVEQQYGLSVFDEDGTELGAYKADLYLAWPLIVEIKACDNLNESHTAQVLGYLRASRIEHGLLINFVAPKLQIKKLALMHDYPNH